MFRICRRATTAYRYTQRTAARSGDLKPPSLPHFPVKIPKVEYVPCPTEEYKLKSYAAAMYEKRVPLWLSWNFPKISSVVIEKNADEKSSEGKGKKVVREKFSWKIFVSVATAFAISEAAVLFAEYTYKVYTRGWEEVGRDVIETRTGEKEKKAALRRDLAWQTDNRLLKDLLLQIREDLKELKEELKVLAKKD